MRHAFLVLAVIALAAPVAATGDEASHRKISGTVLALDSGRRQDRLVRVDAQTLRPVSKRLALGGHASAWSLSPNGRWLAVGVDRAGGVVIVDVRRLKRVGRIRTWSIGHNSAIAWVTPRRIIGSGGAGLFLLDPVARKRLPASESSGEIIAAQRAGKRLVLLTGPAGEVGSAQLAVVDASGQVRTLRLAGIRAGTSLPLETRRGESYRPALVLDPAGRAFVLGSVEEPVAEVDLDRLEPSYHAPRRERSVLARFRNWLEPPAEAKVPMIGSTRFGLWLGDGKIALWGWDSVPVGPERVDTRPAGLSLVDTRAWTSRLTDAKACHVMHAAGTLLASCGHGGLTAFTTDGERRYRRDGEPVATFESRAFLAFDRRPMQVIDAPTGRVLGTPRWLPRVLHPSFSGW